MFDERWPQEAEELSDALAALLAKHCTPETLRALEIAEPEPGGPAKELDRALRDFGLWELPPDPYLLTRAAITLGAHLAPAPFVSATPARVLLDETGVANGVDRPMVPAGLSRVAVAMAPGLGIAPLPNMVRRSAAGERVVLVGDVDPQACDGDADAMRAWGFLLESARLVGASHALIRYGVDYVADLWQFDHGFTLPRWAREIG
jgi:hypothetical protein